MRPFKDYNETPEYTDFKKLPPGAYEVTIIRADDDKEKNTLCILFEISSGEFSNYFHEKFADDKKAFGNTAKFKGVYRLFYPNGGEYDKNSKRKMKTALKLICDQNNLSIDFTQIWDGALLKGAKIGMIFRDQEWEWDGKFGITAQPYKLISLDDLKSGNFTIPEPKLLNNNSSVVPDTNDFVNIPDTGEDLPF